MLNFKSSIVRSNLLDVPAEDIVNEYEKYWIRDFL